MIPSRFQSLQDDVVSSIDDVFGETVRCCFLKNGAADPARPPVEITAIIRVGDDSKTTPSATGGAWGTRLAANKAEMHIDRAKYPNLMFRSGDKVRALSRAGEPWFEIASINDRNGARLVLQLNEA